MSLVVGDDDLSLSLQVYLLCAWGHNTNLTEQGLFVISLFLVSYSHLVMPYGEMRVGTTCNTFPSESMLLL